VGGPGRRVPGPGPPHRRAQELQPRAGPGGRAALQPAAGWQPAVPAGAARRWVACWWAAGCLQLGGAWCLVHLVHLVCCGSARGPLAGEAGWARGRRRWVLPPAHRLPWWARGGLDPQRAFSCCWHGRGCRSRDRLLPRLLYTLCHANRDQRASPTPIDADVHAVRLLAAPHQGPASSQSEQRRLQRPAAFDRISNVHAAGWRPTASSSGAGRALPGAATSRERVWGPASRRPRLARCCITPTRPSVAHTPGAAVKQGGASRQRASPPPTAFITSGLCGWRWQRVGQAVKQCAVGAAAAAAEG
jgi:hypothetical protein